MRFKRPLVAAAVALALAASMASAQRLRRPRQGGGLFGNSYAIRWATADDFDGASFLFCRVIFRTSPYGDGNGWEVDYPRADINLTFRLSELTTTSVSRDGESFNHVVVRLTDPLLFHCPFIMMTEPGGAYFDDDEAKQLREYLLKGGFLWADDFWGEHAFQWWADEIGKALPPHQFPITDLMLDDPIFHVLYDVKRVIQIPSLNFWAGPGSSTSERGRESAIPHARAIRDERGRIMVVMTHNTDFGDAFEREGDNHEYFLQFAPEGYAFGVNTIVWALTH